MLKEYRYKILTHNLLILLDAKTLQELVDIGIEVLQKIMMVDKVINITNFLRNILLILSFWALIICL